ncbi:hypothetical protein [Agrobacterium burrii]
MRAQLPLPSCERGEVGSREMKMREITGKNMNKEHVGPSEYLGFLSQVSQFIDPQIARDAADFDYGQWELPFEAVLIELTGIGLGVMLSCTGYERPDKSRVADMRTERTLRS